MNNPVYNIEVTAEKCSVFINANGFPSATLNAINSSYLAIPINAFLIEQNNAAGITISPLVDSGIPQEFETPKVQVVIKTYELGDIYGPEYGTTIETASFNNFGQFSVNFLNQSNINFKQLFSSISESTEEEMRQFVDELLTNIKKGNHPYVSELFIQKWSDYGRAYYMSPEDYISFSREFLIEGILKNLPPDYGNGTSPVIIEDCFEKKIWRPFFANGEELLYSHEDEEGNINYIPVYLTKIGDEIIALR